MSANDWVGVIGLVIGFVSFAYAIYTQKQLTSLKKYQIGKLRSILKDSLIIMTQSYRLTRNPDKYGISGIDAIRRVSTIHSVSSTLIRALFHELSEIDVPYDEKRLNSYVASGLITSNWVWEQAVTFTKQAGEIKPPPLPDDSKDFLEEKQAQHLTPAPSAPPPPS